MTTNASRIALAALKRGDMHLEHAYWRFKDPGRTHRRDGMRRFSAKTISALVAAGSAIRINNTVIWKDRYLEAMNGTG